MRHLLYLALAAFLLLAACAPSQAPATPLPPEPSPTPTLAPNPAPPPAPTRLTLWLPDWMLLADTQAAAMLEGNIARFEAENGVDVEIILKLPRGEGGLLDFLATTYPVAPGVLPDLIALPYQDVVSAASEGFLQPLDALLDPALQDDLYPFAQAVIAEMQGWMAQPFIADFEHLAFQPSALSDPPVEWSIILESNTTYAFPAGGAETVLPDAITLHYLSALGVAGSEPRDEAALRRLLTFYDEASAAGRIDGSTLQASRPADTWARMQQGTAILGHTTANLWLTNSERASILRFGPVPTADSNPRYLAHGWAYALVTADPARQALVAELLQGLIEPASLAEWSLAAHYLPAQRSSMSQWPGDAFHTFAAEALESAVLPPAWTREAAVARALHRAALDVLSGSSDVDTAIQAAIGTW